MVLWCVVYTLPKFNVSPLENDGWKTSLSFSDGTRIFSGAMLNIQGVFIVYSDRLREMDLDGYFYAFLYPPGPIQEICK